MNIKDVDDATLAELADQMPVDRYVEERMRRETLNKEMISAAFAAMPGEPVAYLVRAEHWGAELAFPQASEQLKKRLEKALFRQVICEPLFATPHPDRVAELEAEVKRLREALINATAHLAGAVSAYDNFRRKGVTGDALYSTRISDFNKALEHARAALKGEGK